MAKIGFSELKTSSDVLQHQLLILGLVGVRQHPLGTLDLNQTFVNLPAVPGNILDDWETFGPSFKFYKNDALFMSKNLQNITNVYQICV